MTIVGISAYYHDSAAALVRDGQLIAAAQEERFTRVKHDPRFPHHALAYCLAEGQTTLESIDHVVFYDKPFLKFERILETHLAVAPRGFVSFCKSMLSWLPEKLFLKKLLKLELSRHGQVRRSPDFLLFSEHHLSHAASAFYPSPFGEAAILTMDGVGEWVTTSVARGEGNRIDFGTEIHFPHSLGLLYSAFTSYLGFRVNSGEYKVMGLAPYGTPRYTDLILEHLIDVREDGSFRLDMRYFDYCTALRMTSESFHRLFGAPPRKPSDELTRFHMDVAASIQEVTTMVVRRLAHHAARWSGSNHLCLAGGVALNCVANGHLLRDGTYSRIWIQPASGDAGGAVGAALAAYHLHRGQIRGPRGDRLDGMQGALLGPSWKQEEIEEILTALGARYTVLDRDALLDRVVDDIVEGKAVGFFQGRMEFGPRALGNRSILADPRSPTMQSVLNLKVKFRESFRPFAPSVRAEDASEWFDIPCESPYMLFCADVVPNQRLPVSEADPADWLERLKQVRSTIPAVTHVDYSARVQTVHRETNPLFYDLVSRFKARTGCPVLLNTSFNVRGEPIVCSPQDAFRCFMGTEIDSLAIGNCHLDKRLQPPTLRVSYRNRFEPD